MRDNLPSQDNLEQRMRKAKAIFDRINPDLEKHYKGKIIAIEEESGNYFIGDSELDTYEQGIKVHPGKTFVYMRIGYGAVHTAFAA